MYQATWGLVYEPSCTLSFLRGLSTLGSSLASQPLEYVQWLLVLIQASALI